VYRDYASRPALLRERLVDRPPALVVIDEVQKVPALLDEVHWLIEVDFVLDDMAVAIEIKGSARVHGGDLRGLRALAEEFSVRRKVVVSLEPEPRTVAPGIEILPWSAFFSQLWAGDLGV